MRFTVTYEGPLLPQKKANSEHKQKIRSHFNEQLSLLWEHKPLSGVLDLAMGRRTADLVGNTDHALAGTEPPETDGWCKCVGEHWFLPIVSDQLHSSASLRIKWFRTETPGKLLQAGDIDNRVKTLCDALQIPPLGQVLPELLQSSRDSPFLCILEDDALITELSVATERLLKRDVDRNDALVIVEVVTQVSEIDLDNMHLI